MIRNRKADFYLIAGIVFVGIFIALMVFFLHKEGAFVRVTMDGTVIGLYPLEQDGQYELANGGNLLVIKDSKAFVKEADCPDKLCMRMGKISKNGQSIICLPNKIVIEIIAEKSEKDFDAIVR